MLFISILLSVWFGLWLMHAIHTKDVLRLLAAWLMTFDDEDEEVNTLLEKSDCAYHLSCEHCNHIWWSTEANVKFCPNCGAKLGKEE